MIEAIAWNDEIHWHGEALDQLRLAGVPLFSGSTIADQLPKLMQELVAAPP